MEVQVVYVFTHDSIGMGEDGPTHQSVEQVASLRAIPQLIVIRPADANETAVAWRVAIETRDRPVALVLTRHNMPTLDRKRFGPAEGLRRGAYILADAPQGKPRLILIASGSEVGLIVAAGQRLQEAKIPVRLVSMPSWKLFEAQSQEYRESVLLPSVQARLAVEAGVTQGWHRYIGDRGEVIGVDRFGASAPGPVHGELPFKQRWAVQTIRGSGFASGNSQGWRVEGLGRPLSPRACRRIALGVPAPRCRTF
jgi:transketolase